MTDDLISRQAAIDALRKALYAYEDKTEKQFQGSDELDVSDWIVHRIFVQNMNVIDRETILALPSAQVTLCHLDSPCEYQNADIVMPSVQKNGDIDEAVEYIKNAQEYLRDIGETWCANYLSDAIELLVGERRKNDY